jgi:RNA polymerase sigma-70 factor (ECF subfamily)
MEQCDSERADPDADHFDRLYRRYGDQIFWFSLRRTGDRTTAEEIQSSVFYEAWRRRRDVDLTTRAALPWLYGVAVNVIRNHLRSTRRREAAFRRLAPPSIEIDLADEATDRVYASDRARTIVDLVNRLPPDERDVVVLCLVGDLSYTCAARELGLPVGTVRSRLSRARARLVSLERLALECLTEGLGMLPS